MKEAAHFGAVIVNYNCARFALDAALSFLGDGGRKAIIVDNDSPDGSADYIAAAIGGRAMHKPAAPKEPILSHAPRFAALEALPPDALELLRAPRNGGFAYGCNVGLRALAATEGLDRFLLLNPDALLGEGALEAFADRLADNRAGLCGATIVSFEAPHRVQTFGGARLDRLFLTGRNIGEGSLIADAPDRLNVERRLDYPLGAAIALRKDYLAYAGYLDERYFLYYEEADWALAGGPAFRPVWAPQAIVYHRYGAASQSRRAMAGEPSKRSPLSDYHMTRSRILFAMKWRPFAAPIAVAAGGAQAAMRLARGRRANAAAVLRAAMPGSPRVFVPYSPEPAQPR